MTLRVLSASDIDRALPMSAAIAGMKEAFLYLSTGRAHMPPRARVEVSAREGAALLMPAYLPDSDDLAIKLVTVFPHSTPVVQAAVLVLSAIDGRPLALLEGGRLTAIRTGAGGGASADLLARPEARVVAVLGSGVQARTGLEAVCAVRSIEAVRVYSPNRAHAEQFAREMAGRGAIPEAIAVAETPSAAVRGADIVYTATTSPTPTFDGRDLQRGAHVIGVGSYTPAMREVDLETVRQSLLVVDSRASALAEAGEIIHAIEQGAISAAGIHAELGEIIAGQKVGRTDAAQITFFKSVGVAVQDVVAARLALQAAERLGLGSEVDF